MGYDYEPIAKCTYPVYSPGTLTLEDDCGEPAIFNIWWWDGEYDLGNINVCQEHFNIIVEQEKKAGMTSEEYIAIKEMRENMGEQDNG